MSGLACDQKKRRHKMNGALEYKWLKAAGKWQLNCVFVSCSRNINYYCVPVRTRAFRFVESMPYLLVSYCVGYFSRFMSIFVIECCVGYTLMLHILSLCVYILIFSVNLYYCLCLCVFVYGIITSPKFSHVH